MPLKHLTETVLVVLLGVMVVLTGVIMDTLPLLPAGALPWAIAFGVALLYALVVYPTLKSNRAEYSFRLLHFLPALMLLIWLVIQLISIYEPNALLVHHWYTWGWALFAVVTGFLLLIAFCLTVIRRRVPRIILLVLLLVPFTGLAFASEQFYHLDDRLSAIVWQGNWWDLVGTGSFIAQRVPANDADPNLAPSDNPAEEAWRRRLRALDERRRQILAERRGTSSSEVSSRSSVTVVAVLPSSSSVLAVLPTISSAPASSPQSSGLPSSSTMSSAQSSVLIGEVMPPPNLPSSGFGLSSIAVALLAGYTGLLHDRARRRHV
ncbi:hypothetical protein HYZ99_00995 [Candidatus Peregrinibacteria bacterium]|nr:hypothetical protein [Candidatus Peregrinibacteria bacterium]